MRYEQQHGAVDNCWCFSHRENSFKMLKPQRNHQLCKCFWTPRSASSPGFINYKCRVQVHRSLWFHVQSGSHWLVVILGKTTLGWTAQSLCFELSPKATWRASRESRRGRRWQLGKRINDDQRFSWAKMMALAWTVKSAGYGRIWQDKGWNWLKEAAGSAGLVDCLPLQQRLRIPRPHLVHRQVWHHVIPGTRYEDTQPKLDDECKSKRSPHLIRIKKC